MYALLVVFTANIEARDERVRKTPFVWTANERFEASVERQRMGGRENEYKWLRMQNEK